MNNWMRRRISRLRARCTRFRRLRLRALAAAQEYLPFKTRRTLRPSRSRGPRSSGRAPSHDAILLVLTARKRA